MRAEHQQMPDHPVDMLIATETSTSQGIGKGEVIGYRCRECGNADETFAQIVHDDGCSMDGIHDYRLPFPAREGPSPGLRREHAIDVIRSATTNRTIGVHNDTVVIFRCRECSNADEDVFEIVHDENCSLARTPAETLAESVPATGLE